MHPTWRAREIDETAPSEAEFRAVAEHMRKAVYENARSYSKDELGHWSTDESRVPHSECKSIVSSSRPNYERDPFHLTSHRDDDNVERI